MWWRSALAGEKPVGAGGELARARQQGLDLRVQLLGDGAAAGARRHVAEAGEEIAHLEQVLVGEQEVAAEPGAVAGVDEAALEQPGERPLVGVEDGAQPVLEIREPAGVARPREVDDRGASPPSSRR